MFLERSLRLFDSEDGFRVQVVETSFATTNLLRTPVTQMIIFNQGKLLLGSNHFLIIPTSNIIIIVIIIAIKLLLHYHKNISITIIVSTNTIVLVAVIVCLFVFCFFFLTKLSR